MSIVPGNGTTDQDPGDTNADVNVDNDDNLALIPDDQLPLLQALAASFRPIQFPKHIKIALLEGRISLVTEKWIEATYVAKSYIHEWYRWTTNT